MINHRVTYRYDTTPVHTRLTIFVNGACIGALTVRGDEIEVLVTLERTLVVNGATMIPGSA